MKNKLRLAVIQMHYWPAYRTQNRDFIDYPKLESNDAFRVLQSQVLSDEV